ncbi:putative Ulp1 protease family catalytic domain-containing protein [Medicago truncatula]|uniref:Putative Ulp1 protease family catalytic domain-containing protein n=1 Tax=Medicago truncatula TaxID=3880 RepID=A0A396G9J1_MEDTR|nr:putative Ulp1 protease family catalytic domain-containing protein [Medicago truncatula]
MFILIFFFEKSQFNAVEGPLNKGSKIPNPVSNDISLADLMKAVENLSKRLDGMEVSNKKLIKDAIQELKNHVQTPNSINGDCTHKYTCTPSPDVEDKRKKGNKTTDWVKNMEKLKNCGTIDISDNEEDDSNGKKRKRESTSYVRADQMSKRQYINKDKQVEMDTSNMKDEVSPHSLGIKPFSSDYRRGVRGKESMTTSASGSMPRRLSFTSSPSPGEGSKGKSCASPYGNKKASPMTGTVKRSSPLGRVKSGAAIGRTAASRKTTALMVPKEDVARGNAIEDLHAYYGKDWLGHFERLRLIYVPIEDSRGHWSLMVISIDDSKIYQLDSHLTVDVREGRRKTIRDIGAALAKLIEIVYDGCMSFCALPDFQYWDIELATGIPNCGTSDNSALWVVEWMNMESSFTNNLMGVIDEDVSRMAVTMRLLTGNHNECNNDLIKNARDYWNMMTIRANKA